MGYYHGMADRLVLVRAGALVDLCELVERMIPLVENSAPNDPLVRCTRGALAELRLHAVLEPATS